MGKKGVLWRRCLAELCPCALCIVHTAPGVGLHGDLPPPRVVVAAKAPLVTHCALCCREDTVPDGRQRAAPPPWGHRAWRQPPTA